MSDAEPPSLEPDGGYWLYPPGPCCPCGRLAYWLYPYASPCRAPPYCAGACWLTGGRGDTAPPTWRGDARALLYCGWPDVGGTSMALSFGGPSVDWASVEPAPKVEKPLKTEL